MVEKTVTVKAKTGLHARPAADLVKFVKQFKSTIYLHKEEKKGNCASILGVLALGIEQGQEIKVTAEGEDEQEAVNAIADFIAAIED